MTSLAQNGAISEMETDSPSCNADTILPLSQLCVREKESTRAKLFLIVQYRVIYQTRWT